MVITNFKTQFMKKLIILFLLVSTTTAFAQSGFGVKAGLNYGDNGEIEFEDVTSAGEDIFTEKADSKMGYHFGVFYRAQLGPVFLKPELLYTQTTSTYQFKSQEADFDVSKLDLPILVGLDIIGPLHIFAGPSLQYILENDLEGVTLEDVENEFTVGAQFGAGVQFGGIGLDVRYERGLTENQAEVLDLDNSSGVQRVDSRPSQIIFSLSLNL